MRLQTIRLYLLAFLFSIFYGASLAIAQPAPQKMDPVQFASQLRLAHVYEETRDYQNAIRIYEELYKEEPDNYDVFHGLAQGYLYQRQYTELEGILQHYLEKNQNDLDILLLLGRTEAKLGKKSEAVDVFQKAIAAAPSRSPKCYAILPVANAMIDVALNDEALDLLKGINLDDDNDGACGPQVANLYMRLAEYSQAVKLYLDLLDKGETNLSYVQQRFAQFTSDSVARKTILTALQEQLSDAKPGIASLQLLSWMYSEQKDYENALSIIIQLDDLSAKERGLNKGFEILNFAERARNEGALATAVKAYDLAIGRIKANPNTQKSNFYLAQAEIGGLKTNEKYLSTKQITTSDEYKTLIGKFEDYGNQAQQIEFVLEAFLHAGNLSFDKLFDLDRATRDYEAVISRSRGFSDRLRDAYFGLVEVAFAKGDLTLAEKRIESIESVLMKRSRTQDAEIMRHALYERALLDFYHGDIDSAQAKLLTVIQTPESDYANDAIQLSALIAENIKLINQPALKIYAKAQLAEEQHDYNAALAAYQSIVETQSFAPLADDAALRAAEVQLELGKTEEALRTLEVMQEKMQSSTILDQAAFRAAEITEEFLHDKVKAQRMYEEFLEKYPKSPLTTDARDRARRLRGDVF